jgi:hypothetical protein
MKALPLIALLACLSCAKYHSAASRPPGVGATQSNWVDLIPQMQLRIENAYYREGLPKHGTVGYLGTETAHFQVRRSGVRLLSVGSPVTPRPADQAPVQDLIAVSQRRFARYRYFYAVVLNRRGNLRGSVLLGARSLDELDRLGAALISDPDSICGAASTHCTVFPEMCTVSIDIEIVVNGAPRVVLSGSQISSIAPGAHHVEVLRRTDGRIAPLRVDPGNLRVPLLPGDQVTWN